MTNTPYELNEALYSQLYVPIREDIRDGTGEKAWQRLNQIIHGTLFDHLNPLRNMLFDAWRKAE